MSYKIVVEGGYAHTSCGQYWHSSNSKYSDKRLELHNKICEKCRNKNIKCILLPPLENDNVKNEAKSKQMFDKKIKNIM